MTDYEIKELYEQMEIHLISSMKRNLKRHLKDEKDAGFKYTQWQAEKIKELKRYQRENQDIIGGATSSLSKSVSSHLKRELKQGALSAINFHNRVSEEKVRADKLMNKSFFKTNDRKVNALIKSVNNDLKKANTGALRMINDQYRQVIHRSAFFAANGVMTEKQAIDMANKDFLARGLNCIEYKNGRRVNIASYAEMAVRTASLRAHLMGEGDFRKSIGRTLVQATSHGGACPICQKWEKHIFIDDVYSGGKKGDGPYMLLSDAMDQGFLHPNCKDGLITYYPELEDIEAEYANDEENQEIQEKINYNDRNIKKYNRLTNGLIDKSNIDNAELSKESYKEKQNMLYSKKWGIDSAFIDDLDENVIKEIDNSVQYNLNKYPELKKKIKGVGSIQSKNSHKFEEIKQIYYERLKENIPSIDETSLERLSTKYAKEQLPRASKNVYAISMNKHKFNLDGIYVHNKYGKDYSLFIKCINKDVKTKFHPIGTNSIKSIIDHEFGHQLDNLLDIRNNTELLNLYKKLSKNDIYLKVSKYANQNIAEFIAECYSEYVNNPNCKSIARKVGAIIDNEYIKRFKK